MPRSVAFVCLIFAVACDATGAGRRTALGTAWTVDTAARVVLGAAVDDTTQLFATVLGATRLPDGGVLVADGQAYALLQYDSRGGLVRRFGSRGSGPGEFMRPTQLWRCGDSVIVSDLNANRTSVFDLSGRYVRAFTFGGGSQARWGSPYQSACNRDGTFAHFGWEDVRSLSADRRVFRQRVPFWISGLDSAVRAALDSFPGSERVVSINQRTGLPSGTGPRLFGKQTSIALGSDRLYIGTGDSIGIIVVRLADRVMDTLALSIPLIALTQADIAAEREREIASSPPSYRAGIERMYGAHPFPDTLPAYARLVVDSEDLLWVQEYPRAGTPTVRWRILSRDGQPIAHAELPTFLEVYEIGIDYVLGRYLDPVEAIPQVRMYALTRRNDPG